MNQSDIKDLNNLYTQNVINESKEEDIKDLTENLILNNKSVNLSERLFWVVVSALTATVVYYIR
mgnify:CR=1 FL=1